MRQDKYDICVFNYCGSKAWVEGCQYLHDEEEDSNKKCTAKQRH